MNNQLVVCRESGEVPYRILLDPATLSPGELKLRTEPASHIALHAGKGITLFAGARYFSFSPALRLKAVSGYTSREAG